MQAFSGSASELYEQYDLIISDVFGIVHNGQSILPGSLKLYSRHHNKIVLLTNDGRSREAVQAHLSDFNFHQSSQYKEVYSSGFFLDSYLSNQSNIDVNRCCYMFEEYLDVNFERIRTLKELYNVNFVDDANEASFCLASGIVKDKEYILADNNDLTEKLKQLVRKSVPLLCPNPDRMVVYGEDQVIFLAKMIAEKYKRLGGHVCYFGKPEKDPFTYILKQYPDKKKVLMVGDSLETDILGANQSGIDSLLVRTGVAHQQWMEDNKPDFNTWLLSKDTQPTWYIEDLN